MDRPHTLRKPRESTTRQALTWKKQGKEEARKAKKHLAKRPADRHEENRLHLEGNRKRSPKPRPLEEACPWPIPSEG